MAVEDEHVDGGGGGGLGFSLSFCLCGFHGGWVSLSFCLCGFHGGLGFSLRKNEILISVNR